jgi:hypothetical protein
VKASAPPHLRAKQDRRNAAACRTAAATGIRRSLVEGDYEQAVWSERPKQLRNDSSEVLIRRAKPTVVGVIAEVRTDPGKRRQAAMGEVRLKLSFGNVPRAERPVRAR